MEEKNMEATKKDKKILSKLSNLESYVRACSRVILAAVEMGYPIHYVVVGYAKEELEKELQDIYKIIHIKDEARLVRIHIENDGRLDEMQHIIVKQLKQKK